MYIHNINIHNTYIHNVNMYIFLLRFIYRSRFCCFTAPVATQNNDNDNLGQPYSIKKYQNKNLNKLGKPPREIMKYAIFGYYYHYYFETV